MGNGALSSVVSPLRVRSRTRDLSSTIFDVIDCNNEDNTASRRPLPLIFQRNHPTSQDKSMEESDLKAALKASLQKEFMFQSLHGDHIEKLCDCFVPITCGKGEIIIHEGDHGDYMYFVESGLFDVLVKLEKVGECQFGDFFGELALLYNAKRAATIKCRHGGKVWALDRHTLRHFQQFVARKSQLELEIILKSIPLLQHLDKSQFALAKKVATRVEFKLGELIIKKGDIGDTFYIITEGSVVCSSDQYILGSPNTIPTTTVTPNSNIATSSSRGISSKEVGSRLNEDPISLLPVVHINEEGSYRTLSAIHSGSDESVSLASIDTFHLSKGDWFGEIALLTPGSLRTANVVATSKVVKLLAFNEKSFQDALGSLKDIIDKRSFLRSQPLLEGLSQEKIDEAIRLFTVEKYSQGDVMCKCGDPVSRIMVMRSGKASVWKHPRPSELTQFRSSTKSSSGTFKDEETDVLIDIDISTMDGSILEEAEIQNMALSRRDRMVDNSSQQSNADGRTTTQAVPEHVNFGVISSALDKYVLSGPSSWSHRFARTELGAREASWRQHNIFSAGKEANLKDSSEKRSCNCNADGGGDNSLDDEFSSELRCGDVIGMEAVTNNKPMEMTVIAQEEVSCFVITEEDWKTLLRSNTPSLVIPEKSSVDWTKLELKGKLGSGTFGVVYAVQDQLSKRTYAMKVLNKNHVKAKKQEKRVISETQLMLNFQCSAICKCYDANDDDDAYYLLMEMLIGGELKKVIHPQDRLLRDEQTQRALQGELAGIPAPAAKFYAAALAIPLMYMHRQGVAYRDLKPDNVVLDHNGYPKLIDFGLSKQLDMCSGEQTYTMCGTPEYLAPEVIMGSGYNQAVDWWSLGVIIYEMMVGMTPFCDTTHTRNKADPMIIFENIAKNRIRFPKGLDDDCKYLISKLLEYSPAQRLGSSLWSFKVFEQHPWFENEVDWYALKMRRIPPPYVPSQSSQSDVSSSVVQCIA